MKRSVVLFLLLALLLAGCTSDGDDLEPTEGTTDGGGASGGNETDGQAVATGQQPAPWDVGHYWSYQTSFGTDFTLVVSEDKGDDWYLDTPEEDTAWFNVRDPISYLGDVRKSDLAGSQGSNRVQYFDFPLEEGKEWTTSWDGVERRIVTVEANETFRFEAYQDGELAVEYDYDPEVGWFTEVVFYEGEDGQESFSFTLNDHQTGWTGDVVRWDAESYVNLDERFSLAGGSSASFTVDDDVEELWIRYWFHCEEGHTGLAFIQGTIAPVAPMEALALLIDGCMDEEALPEFENPAAGDWEFAAFVQSMDPDHFVMVELEVWGRALETHTVS